MIFKMIKVLLHVFKTNRQGREEKVQGKNYEEKLGPEWKSWVSLVFLSFTEISIKGPQHARKCFK